MIKTFFKIGTTTNHTAKMEGMSSFSTDTMSNEFCNAMRKCEGSVCSKCFSARMHNRLKNFTKKMVANGWIKHMEIKKCDVPFVNSAYFRFEAFGELSNMVQLNNYITIAKGNPHCMFALWTKRTDLLLQLKTKPRNLNIIVSSSQINKQKKLPVEIVHLVSSIFTVYDKKGCESVTINCGDKKCVECLACYKKVKGIQVINEKLK
ncbi:MAG: GP88 family protein [Cetobacterium sp.]